MRKQLYWLSDEEWRRLERLLPRGRRGAHRVDDRRVISGIMHMLRSGARWRDARPNTELVRRGNWGCHFFVLGSTPPVTRLAAPGGRTPLSLSTL
jgi:Putative transposase of IS4/5 family (DUF4096)